MEPDQRFEKWAQRDIEGSWDVENGALAELGLELRAVNAVSFCAVGAPLFDSEDHETLRFPTAQNNHRYHDAHSEVYKLLIDGLNAEALKKLANRLDVSLPPKIKRKLKILGHIVGNSVREKIIPAFEVVSENRGYADHNQRPPAAPMKAQEQFNADMKNLVNAIAALKEHLAQRLGVTVESCIRRQESSTVWYPKFDEELTVRPNYSICTIRQVVGKRISDVRFGFRKQAEGLHNGELMILYFDDDSYIAIHTGSNSGNLASEHEGLKPEDFTASFLLNFVPALELAEESEES